MLKLHLLFKSDTKSCAKSGFGLLAVRKLLRTRGGDIIGTAAPGDKGLSVTVYLPGAVDFFKRGKLLPRSLSA